MTLFSRLFPLVMLFVVLAVLVCVGLVVYNIVMDVTHHTKKQMEKNNVMLSREGVTVELNQIPEEEYKDKTQSVLVDIWNHSTVPALKYRWRREK
ncbi:hypothetical protein LOZ61_002492 [Ophidiomyces ophidiicola]|nr:hypothetical protein LOZ61_002492 [Ophidiomyces ophidiicola]KAI1916279.1 hypothetical protein LOZ65_005306 [Ophidiomyces ophidiicola]KAI1939058.1 hypothetical protein LOZ66_003136 [Ophidiomyces ophidiicola]KAI1962025.1 hypothetical protein LOZ58_003104 [Ophidiomyces ophidiicola]KAI2018580.1 hypothetical protein LOZ46_003759 [Ophidiomyces ophidiicola]